MGVRVKGAKEVPTPGEEVPVPVQYSSTLPFAKFSGEREVDGLLSHPDTPQPDN